MSPARSAQTPARSGLTLTQQIVLGLILGVVAGTLVSRTHPEWAQYFNPFSQLFLRLIKMIIAPLIFGTLVAGIAGAGHVKAVGRIGLRAMIYFEVVTTIALLIGLLAVNILKPGVGLVLPAPSGAPVIAAAAQTWDQILLHTFPTSIVQAMAEGDVLQVVVWSIIFAIALTMVGPKARPMIEFCESLAEAMVKFTNIVMKYAPIGVALAMAYTIGKGGFGVLYNLAWLVGTLYIALLAFYLLVLLPVMIVFKIPVRKFFKAVKEPAVIAFSTTSSEAALPRGYSFNLDGSTLYLTLAAVFVAQAANIHLSIGQQITMLLTLMLTSKGVAGVPRASLVILAATLSRYGLPLEGVTLILGVDTLMDMGRTMTNVIGNCLASVVVALSLIHISEPTR